eukprot:1150771-Pelagomonas_calceolata.AAC.6
MTAWDSSACGSAYGMTAWGSSGPASMGTIRCTGTCTEACTHHACTHYDHACTLLCCNKSSLKVGWIHIRRTATRPETVILKRKVFQAPNPCTIGTIGSRFPLPIVRHTPPVTFF